ncbi:MAG: 7-carboxy-7-deazaguanine synthase QueE [Gammaproteobacteria bacterium]|nr:7-carboxy-7-deazaguanine synthase QueE [Gammaproteobacteria bacterium]MCY4181428.1 7-carboxy-7-deazaguanine synthase QueE [Gammaproteobacteria bacterium]
MALRITEIFHSLQGETRTVGIPTVFVRLTGCPLRCAWCDTAYAFSGGETMEIGAVIEQVAKWDCGYVTVTGGEPLAQAQCHDLLRELCDRDYRVSLETSGAMPLADVDGRVCIVMDLKAPASRESHRNRYENLEHLRRSDQLKFVIQDRGDYEWSAAQIRQRGLAGKVDEILFSPVHGELAPALLAQWILDDRLPVRMQIQLHKLLWNAEPGR